jgi:2-keto-4-pentenoate hydratase/2-oxohepta-3-ene-1,7-dioic acid hydratase (catechol pathway)
MRFISYYDAQGCIRPAAIPGDPQAPDAWAVDLSHPSLAARFSDLPDNLAGWVEHGLADIARRVDAINVDEDARLALASLRLAAPLPRPGKIIGAAFNYHDALAERNMTAPPEPVIFVKSGRTVIGPNQPILVSPASGDVTYEAELAVIIGTAALHVPRERAMDHVAAYAIFNDVSATTLVKADGGFVRGKNQPASGPFGPWMVMAEDVDDPYALDIRLEIGTRVLQQSTTGGMVFDIAALIEYASARMPLDPGDVIATGTPAGVAGMHTPPAWLKPGDTVSITIDGLGQLTNPVAAGNQRS